jgi:hypothetical protein
MNHQTLSPGARLTAVKLKNAEGQEIGKVVEWFMDVEEGRVVYVVAEFRNNGNYFPIPWSMMKADVQKGGYIVDEGIITKTNLRIDRNTMADLPGNPEFTQKVLESFSEGRLSSRPGNEQSASTPSGEPLRTEGKPGAVGAPSNAEISEGKGYGG